MTLQRITAVPTALEIVVADAVLDPVVAVAIHDAIGNTVDIVVVGKFSKGCTLHEPKNSIANLKVIHFVDQ